MKVTIFGATGLLGRECLSQCLEADHEVTVLARTPSKLPAELRDLPPQLSVVSSLGLHPLTNGIETALLAEELERAVSDHRLQDFR